MEKACAADGHSRKRKKRSAMDGLYVDDAKSNLTTSPAVNLGEKPKERRKTVSKAHQVEEVCRREAKVISPPISKSFSKRAACSPARRSSTRSNGRKTASSARKSSGGGRKVTSRYIGVSYHANRGKWQVKIRSNGKQKHLGYFEDEDDAARAYNRAAKAVHANPKINQVPDDPDPGSEVEQQKLSLDARIEHMTRQQKEVKEIRQMKPRRATRYSSAPAPAPAPAAEPPRSKHEVSKRHRVRKPPAPRRWAASVPELDLDEEDEQPKRRDMHQPSKIPPLRMEKLTKEVDTPTLFPSGMPFSPNKMVSSQHTPMTDKPPAFKKHTNLRNRRSGKIGSLQVDIAPNKISTLRKDAMLKLTPVTTSIPQHIRNPRLQIENPAVVGSNVTPRNPEDPGELFPISPAFNTYCT